MEESNEIQDLPLKAVLKDILLNWCETSTAHAIPNIVRSRSVVVIVIWVCCLLASGSYCIVSVVVSIQNYLSNQAFISFQVVQDTPTDFPAVTFCNFKSTNKIRAKDYINSVLYQNGTSVLPYYGDNIEYFIWDTQYLIKAAMVRSENLTDTMRTDMGFKLEEMIVTCSFNWRQCKISDFELFFNPFYGNCYTFNKAKLQNETIRKATLPGPEYGLVIELFTGDPNSQTQYELNDGIVVEVHNASTAPMLNSHRIIVPTGTETDLKINRNFVSKLDYPYSNCLKDTSETSDFKSEFFEYIVKTLKVAYTQEMCSLLCFQKHIFNACKCAFAMFQMFRNEKLCLTEEEMQCFGERTVEFGSITSSHECVSQCPLECNFIEYRVASNRATYPTPYYKTILAELPLLNKSGIPYADIDRAVLKLNVFYESVTYTSIVESPSTTPETFFSNIGGTLGLYLGISVLSVIEIVELVIKVIEILYIRRKKRKINQIRKTNLSV